MNVVAKVEELASRLELKEKAQQDALAGVPAADSDHPTRFEEELVGRVRGEGEKELAGLQSQYEAAQNALDAYKKAPKEPVPLDTAVLDDKEQLLRKAHKGAMFAFNKFKENHGLDREPAQDDRATQLMLALFVVIVEGLANSYFFAAASQYGLAGGFFAAFMFSFVNVAFAFMGGVMGLRYAGHTDPAKKMGGMLWALACALVCALVVCLSAWYRGHLDRILHEDGWSEAIEFAAWQASLGSLADLDWWQMIASLEAFLLLGVGVICAIVGFWKGHSFDDPFPGYGKMARSREDAAERLDQFLEEKQGRLPPKDPAQQALTRAEVAIKGLREALGRQDLGLQAADLAKQLLQIYREENNGVRAPEPPPPYFQQYPGQADFADLAKDWQELREKCDGLERELGGIAPGSRGSAASEQGAAG